MSRLLVSAFSLALGFCASAASVEYAVTSSAAEDASKWSYYWGSGGSLKTSSAADPSGGPAVVALDYAVAKDAGYVVVNYDGQKLREGTDGVRLRLFCAKGNAKLAVRILDATGETHLYDIPGATAWTGWREIPVDLRPAHAHWGGRNTGIIAFPATLALQMTCSHPSEGRLLLSRADARMEITERNRYGLALAPATTTVWHPGETSLRLELTDLAAEGLDFPVSYRVTDNRGRIAAKGETSVSFAKGKTAAKLDISFASKRLGMHYLSVSVRSPRHGREVAALTTSAAVVSPGKFGDAPFGMNLSTATRCNGGEREALAKLAYSSGVRWTRDEFSWERIEPVKGKFNWQDTDAGVEAETKAGLRILGILAYSASWARRDANAYTSPPSRLEDYAAFVYETVRRYRGKVRHWEIWNEPDSPAFWPPKPEAADYARLLKAGYEAAKRADPDCVVLPAGLLVGMNHPDNWAFLNELLAAGSAAAPFDRMAWHPYCEPSVPERGKYLERTEKLASMLKSSGRDLPIWMTEFGWPTLPHRGALVSEEDHAAYLVRSHVFMLASSAQVETLFWFLFRDGANREGDVEQSFGVLNPDGSPKASYPAFVTMARFLAGARRERIEKGADGVWSAAFRRPNGTALRVVWRESGESPLRLSGETAYDIDGNRLDTEAVVVGTSPVYCVK